MIRVLAPAPRRNSGELYDAGCEKSDPSGTRAGAAGLSGRCAGQRGRRVGAPTVQ
jgi:hypothetical protein